MADPLTKISSKYKCDKSDKNHRYTQLYHQLFKNLRDEKFTMLEYGYGVGNSVKLWLEYFSKAKLISVDIGPKPKDKFVSDYIKSGRLKYVSANQIDKEKLVLIMKKHGPFKFIIDDASHMAADQQFTFNFSFPYVVPGGWYIIEDLKCKRSHSPHFEIEAEKTLKVLERYLQIQRFESMVLTEQQNKWLTENIESLSIHDKISFIKKKG